MGGVAAKLIFKKGKEKMGSSHTSLFDIEAVDIDGHRINKIGDLVRDKRCIMVVNVASKWGLTDKSYKQMVKLHQGYRDKGFEILAFPCN